MSYITLAVAIAQILGLVLLDVSSQESQAAKPNTNGQSALPPHPPVANEKSALPTPIGTETVIGNISLYETPEKVNSKTLLIAVYDLFGFHPHVKYVADKISEGDNGIRVVIPDFFHGKAYDFEKFPPPNFQNDIDELFLPQGWWDKSLKEDLLNVIHHYKSKGVDKFGIFGFCWGGKMSAFAASDSDFSSYIKAAGLVHPSKVVTADSENAHCPMILLPSKDEPDMIPFLNKLNSVFDGQCEHKRFPDMKHGFAGARSDFSDTLVRTRVNEVIQLLKVYFNARFK